MHQLAAQAMLNHPTLVKEDNICPGHVLVAGINTDNTLILFLAKTSKKPARKFKYEEDLDFIKAHPTHVRVMERARCGPHQLFGVGNGDHVGIFLRGMERGQSFYDVVDELKEHTYAKLPRLGAVVRSEGQFRLWMCHMWYDRMEREPRRQVDTKVLERGGGYCLHTMQWPKDGLPSAYDGDPFAVELNGPPEELFRRLWSALPPKFFCAAVMQVYSPHSRTSKFFVENRFAPRMYFRN